MEEKRRSNIGYLITASFEISKGLEVVLGVNQSTGHYGTWLCHQKTDYYNGNYYVDFKSAFYDFQTRAC